MFVVDDLVTWLVERLADAGYQKLKRLVVGSDYERELIEAVKAALQATASEISPSDKGRAKKLAELISGAFGKRTQAKLLPRRLTRRDGLYAAIAQQLSVLDDGGQPPGELLEVPVSEVAARLGYHLVEEIKNRGAQGGPLAALASQLNHDETRLQGQQLIAQGERLEDQVQRIEGMLAELLGEVRDGQPPPDSTAGPVGWPLAKVDDPFALEVHRPVEPDVPQAELPVLPVYLPREHDAALAEVVTAAAAGTSGIAVLVGGSSTGKTRACWQALELLRDLEPEWQLWHPIDPRPPQAALAGLRSVGPRTVVWLNEAQRYFASPDGAGERVAAGLRELLRSPGRGPVVVLATLWPKPWNELTARPSEGADPHAQARELLAGHNIGVPDAFTDDQLRELEGAGDPRLAQAAAGSRDGQVIQYLAGAPDLLDRYRNALPGSRALIDAAMDARRLGMGLVLPRVFLETAAPGYMTDTDQDLLTGDWLERALKDTAEPRKGVRGPLAPIRPGHAPSVSNNPGTGPACELADYLDQHGRRARRELMPPASFWAAASSYADLTDLGSVGEAAEGRGLYRDAAGLYKRASGHGDPVAAARLVVLLHAVHPGDRRPARWAAARASLDNPQAAGELLNALVRVGVDGIRRGDRSLRTLSRQRAGLAKRAAAYASLDDTHGVARLMAALSLAGANRPFARLASRAIAHVSLDNPRAVAQLLRDLRIQNATGQITALLDRDPATHVSLDDTGGVARLLSELREVGATGQVTALLDRDPATHASLDDTGDVAALLRVLAWGRATGQVTALVDRDPAAHASLDKPGAVADLLRELKFVRATGQVTVLLDRDPATHVSLDEPGGLGSLLHELKWAGATGQVAALASRVAAHASIDQFRADYLLKVLPEVGAAAQAATLASRAAAHISFADPYAVADMLDALRKAGVTDQVTVLLDRDPAAHASLDRPLQVAHLLDSLHRAGATSQVAALASRAAAHASLDDPLWVTVLLESLRKAGARAEAAELIQRLPAAGLFKLFSEQEGSGEQFRFGRETDGRLAQPWTWTDVN